MAENNNTDIHNEMTVGEMLRNARTTGRRKREIPTISKQLCIREEFLQALEDGNYNVIPETVYILGFARNYAMELGLNPDEVVGKLKREMGLVSDSKDEEDDDKKSNVATSADTDVVWYRRAWGAVAKFMRRYWIWVVSGVVVVALAVGGAVYYVASGDDETLAGDAQVAVPVATVDNSEPKYTVQVRERFGTENAETASVILQAIEESWVKIEDARGGTVFSRVLVPGDVYYVPSEQNYTAIFGNAGGVDVWVNGVLIPKRGAQHERVADISMNPDDLVDTTTAE